MNRMSYKLWRDCVIALLFGNGLILHYNVSEDIYIHYYEDGYTPSQALVEDLGVDFRRLNFPIWKPTK